MGTEWNRAGRRVAAITLVVFGLSVAVPAEAVPAGGSFPIGWLTSWFGQRPVWAGGLLGDLPKQQRGGPTDGEHYVPTDATRANGGAGRKPQAGSTTVPARDVTQPKGQPFKTPKLDPTFDPATSKRIASRSDAKSDVFQNADGSFTRRVHTGPTNFKAADGTWQKIDTTLQQRPDGRLHMKANSLTASMSRQGGAAKRGVGQPLVSVTLLSGEVFGYDLEGAADVAPSVSGSTAMYRDILPLTDMELQTFATGMKDTLVLRSPDAPNSWLYPLHLKGLTPRLEADGSIALLNNAGTAVAWIPRGTMEDSQIELPTGEPVASDAVTYELVKTDKGTSLRVTADEKWLRDPARVYPVRVDPSTYTSTTMDAFTDYDGSTTSATQNGNSLAVGYDNESAARSFIHFGDFAAQGYLGVNIVGARLALFHTWSWNCTTHLPIYVHRVQGTWSDASIASGGSWPGPGISAPIGELTITNNYPACQNTSANRSTGQWQWVPLSSGTFRDWAAGQPNLGLAVTSIENNAQSWKRFTSSAHLSNSVGPVLELSWLENLAPQVNAQYPTHGYVSPTLTPELMVEASDPDNSTGGMTYKFIVHNTDGQLIWENDNFQSSSTFTVPVGKLEWAKSYIWTVLAKDVQGVSNSQTMNMFSTPVPQPLVTSGLSQNGGQGFEPSIGNYTTAATDATVATVGPGLLVQRSYNSLDPRVQSSFGAGWSTMFDAKVVEQKDAAGVLQTVLVTYPSGQEVVFGRNGNGTFTPPSGRFATFTGVSGGYQLVDKDGTKFLFNSGAGMPAGTYELMSITDVQGRVLSLMFDSAGKVTTVKSASGRRLHFTWSTPSGATAPHVATVTTDPATPGVPSSALTWTYTYSGDRLTKVCPPTSSTACHEYGYGDSSQYPNMILNAGPTSYWRLGDPAGSAVAASEVLSKVGTDAGVVMDVTFGGAGPLTGSSATVGEFNGTSSRVALQPSAAAASSSQTLSLWFKVNPNDQGILFGFTRDVVTAGGTTSGGYAPALYVGTSGKLHGAFWNGSPTTMQSQAVVDDGNWHHATLTASGSGQKLYLDGLEVATRSGAMILSDIAGSPNLTIGSGFSGGGWPDQPWYSTSNNTGHANSFKGSIAEVAYLDRALSATDVAALWGVRGNSKPLTSVKRPSGNLSAQVAYHPASGLVTQVTDSNGGVWQIAKPVGSGSYQAHAGAVLSSGPKDYWRYAETGVTTAINQVNGKDSSYSGVTLGDVAGPFNDPNRTDDESTAASFDGASSYVQVPAGSMLGDNVSQAMWFKTGQSGRVLASHGGQPTLWITANGKLAGAAPAEHLTTKLMVLGKCLDVQGNFEGSLVVLHECHGGAHQTFTFFPDGTVRSWGRCMSAQGAGTANGTPLSMWTCNGTPDQKWTRDGGRLVNVGAPDKCADLPDSNTTNQTGFTLYTCNTQPNQQIAAGMTSSATVTGNQWHHVVLTRDAYNHHLYLDGVKVGEIADSGLRPATSSAGKVGAGGVAGGILGLGNGPDSYFAGSIAEVAIWGSKLSAEQIAALFKTRANSSGMPVRTVVITDPGGGLTTHTYDALAGFKLAETNALGKTTQYGYNELGFPHTVTDPNGNMVTSERDVRGNVVETVTCQDRSADACSTTHQTYYPDDTTRVLTPDPRNDLLLTSRDGRSASKTDNTYLTTYTYDAKGNRTAVTDPLGRTTTMTYTEAPILSSSTPFNGDVTVDKAFDRSWSGLTSKFTTFAGGWLQAQYATPQTVSTVVIRHAEAGGEPAVYNTRDFDILTSIDGSTWTTHQVRGNTAAVSTHTLPTPVQAKYLKIAVINGTQDTEGIIRIYEVETDIVTVPAGLPRTVTSPGGGVQSVEYDSNGDGAKTIDAAGKVTTFTYDGLGRMLTQTETTSTFPAGLTTTFTYDGQGRQLTQTRPAVTNRVTGAVHRHVATQTFDVDGNVLSVVESDASGGDASRTSSVTYNAHGRRATETDALGKTTTFHYDGFGRPTRIINPDTTETVTTYDLLGNELTVTLKSFTGDPNAPSAPADVVLESKAYDPGGRLARTTDAMGWRTEHTYTDNNLLAKTVRVDPSTGASFTLESISYDAAGNVISAVTNNGATRTDSVIDQAGRVSGVRLDPLGLDRQTSYTFTPDDEVTSVTVRDRGQAIVARTEMSYDVAGRLTAQTVVNEQGPFAGLVSFVGDINSDGQGDLLAVKGDDLHRWYGTPGGGYTYAGTIGSGWAAYGPSLVGTTDINNDQRGDLVAIKDDQLYRFYSDGAGGFTAGGAVPGVGWGQYAESLTGGDFTGDNKGDLVAVGLDGKLRRWTGTGAGTFADGGVHGSHWERYVGSMTVGDLDGNGTDDLVAIGDGLLHQWKGTASGFTYAGNAGGGWGPYRGSLTGVTDVTSDGMADLVAVHNDELIRWNGVAGGTFGQMPSWGGGWGPYVSTTSSAGAHVSRTSYVLDNAGLVTSVTDPNGNTTDYGYDEAGRAVVTTAPQVSTEVFGQSAVSTRPVSYVGFDTFGAQTHAKDANGRVTAIGYDAVGRQVSTTMPSYTAPGASTPLIPVSSSTYNQSGQLATSTDPSGGVTSYLYDQLGRVVKTTAPDGGVTKFGYDLAGDRLSRTDPTGAVMTATYDYLGRTLTSTDVVRQTSTSYTTTKAYNGSGWLASTTSPNGVVDSSTYNAVGEVLTSTDGANSTTTYRYDAAGQRVRVTLQDDTYTTATYDLGGRLKAWKSYNGADALLTTVSSSYDANSNVVASTDARGNTTTFTYDATNLLTSQVEPVSLSETITSSFGYDQAGAQTRHTNGRNVSFHTTYNSWGLPESVIEPATAALPNLADRTFTTSYDIGGRAVTQTMPGGVSVQVDYDEMGRITEQTGSGAEAATVAKSIDYDLGGRITSISGPGGANTLAYDDRGLLLSTSGASGSSSFVYDAASQLTSRTDAAGVTSFGYDAAGRVSTVANPTTGVQLAYGYNSLSQPATVTYGVGGDQRWYTYDDQHRLTVDELKTAGGASVAKIVYGWDANSNETSKSVIGFTGSAANAYTYDQANRLTSWTSGSTTVNYAYDKASNRTQAGSKTFTYDERNQLLSAPSAGITYQYTPRGTLRHTVTGSVSVDTAADAFGQVVKQHSTATAFVEYSYDGLGRAFKSGFAYTGLDNTLATDGTALYTRDDSGNLLGVAQGTDKRLAWTDLHTDVVGQFGATSTALTGSTTYDPLGQILATTGTLGKLGYQSEYTETSTGRVNMLARWYNPDTGQFDSRDTMSNSPTPSSANANRHAYANANPMTGTDPTGHFNLFKAVGKVFSKAVNTVKPFATSIANTVYNGYQAAKNHAVNTFNDVKNHVVEKAKQAVNHLTTTVKKAATAVKKATVQVAAQVTKKFEQVKQAVNTVVKAPVAVYQAVVDTTKKTLAEGAARIADAYQSVEQWAIDHKAEIAGFVVGAVVGIGCGVAIGWTGVGAVACGALAGAAGSLVTGAMNGKTGWDLVGDVALGALGGAIGGGVFSALGAGVSSALGGGVKSLLSGGLKNVASKFGGGFLDEVANIGGGVKGLFGSGGLKNLGTTALGNLKNAGQAIKGFFKGGGCKNSFDPATRVLLAAGGTKPIGEIAIGDEVVATDPETGRTESKPVTALHVNLDTELTDLAVRSDDSGETTVIKTTQNHPFWDAATKEWTDAGALKPGESVLIDPQGGTSTVVAVENYSAAQDMRNLSVADIHTYYVLAGDQPVLVHNCGGNEIGTKVDYFDPSDDLVNAVHNARLGANDRGGNWASAMLDDGSIITARSGPGKNRHAEVNLFDLAGDRKITDLYTERAPCANRCQGLLGGINVRWSFGWNGADAASTKAIRSQSNAGLGDAIKGLFSFG